MKIAKYKLADWEHISEVTGWKEKDASYVRTTEVIDVHFTALPLAVTIPKELAVLEDMEKQLTAKHLTALQAIQSRRKDLLALAPPELVKEAS